MRGWLVLVAVAAAAVLVPAGAVAQVPTGDAVFGSGHVLLTDFTVDIEAGPAGENPSGTLVLSGFLSFTATPTCLNVVGNEAVGAYRIESGSQAGQGFIAAVVDNGPPVDGQPVDTVPYTGLLPSPPATCPAPGEPPPPGFLSTGGGPLTTGDITVVDGSAAPTTKRDCKAGGWRAFGFRSQGACVASVQRAR